MLNKNSNGVSTIISNLSLVISFCFFIIGWIISFVSTFIYSNKPVGDKTWIWWIMVNCFICACVVFLIIERNIIQGYRFALMTYLGLSINWSIGLVNGLLHSDFASGNAVGVGQLLVSVAYFIWILYFGCDKETSVGKLTCSNTNMRSVPNPNAKNYNLQNVTTDSAYQNEQSLNTSPSLANLRAEALFDYSANKDDPNEISFSQGEIMEILDNNGRWWQARKSDGTMGIVPSNFFKLI